MTAPYFAPGDPMLVFAPIRQQGIIRRIEKVAVVVQQVRGSAYLADGPHGTRYFIVGGWIQSIIHADAKFGEGVFTRIHADPDDMRYWHPYSATSHYAEIVPWIDQSTYGLWCIYTRETLDEETNADSPKIKKENFIGFEDETDAIHYKLRWIG